MSLEQQLIVATSRISLNEEQISQVFALLTESLDWQKTILSAREHQVSMLMFHSLSNCGLLPLLPESALEAFKYSYMQNMMRNELIYAELDDLLNAFASEEIPVILLKGAALARTLYPKQEIRFFNDVDLLIPHHLVQRSREILKEKGFVLMKDCYAVSDDDNDAIGCEWSYHRDGFLVEIHWNLVEKVLPFEIDPEELFIRAEMISIDGHNVRALSPEDQLLHQCIHQFKHGWQRLMDLCDIAEFIKAHDSDLDWQMFIDLSESARTDKVVYYTLELSKQILDAPVPVHVMECLEQRVKTNAVERSIFELVERNTFFNEVPYGFWPIILVDGFMAKMNVVKTAISKPLRDSNLIVEKQGGSLLSRIPVLNKLIHYRHLIGELFSLFVRDTFKRVKKQPSSTAL